MLKTTLPALLAALLAVACSTTEPTIQSGDDAEVIGGNLYRIDNSRADAAYVDPNADFSRYRKVLLRPLGVDNVQVIQPSSSGSALQRRDWALTDSDRVALQEMFHKAMVTELQKKGSFPLVEEAGEDVLEIAAMVTAVAPSASKDDASRGAGRSYVITEGAGSVAVAVAFGDSRTGEVLALAKDSRSSTTNWGLNNRVTNRADVQRMFNAWATQINTTLVKVTGVE